MGNKPVISAAAANRCLRAYIAGNELKHRAGIVIKPAHYMRVNGKLNALGSKIFLHRLKVRAAVIT